MKINPVAYGVGNSGLAKRAESDASKPHVDFVALKSENTDKIMISDRATKKADTDQLTKAIVSWIERPASPERLACLQEAVNNKTYYVPASDLASALMQHWIGI